LDRETLAPGAHRSQLDQLSRRLWITALADARQGLRGVLAQRGRSDQLPELIAERLRGPLAEDPLGVGAELRDAPVAIDCDHAMQRIPLLAGGTLGPNGVCLARPQVVGLIGVPGATL